MGDPERGERGAVVLLPCGRGLLFSTVFNAIGGTLDLHHVRMVDEPIEDGGSDRIVIEDLAPILERAVCGEDHGALFVTVGHDLEEKVGAILVERQEAQLIDDEEFRRAETVDGARKRVIGLGGGEGIDEIGGGDPEGFNFFLTGGVGKCQGDVGLADAGGTNENEIGIGVDEIEGEGIEDERFGNGGGMGPVERIQSFDAGDPCVFQSSADDAFMAKGILGREEPCEKFQMGNIFKGGLLGLILEGAGGMKESERGEQVGQRRVRGREGHGVLLGKGHRRVKDPVLQR